MFSFPSKDLGFPGRTRDEARTPVDTGVLATTQGWIRQGFMRNVLFFVRSVRGNSSESTTSWVADFYHDQERGEIILVILSACLNPLTVGEHRNYSFLMIRKAY